MSEPVHRLNLTSEQLFAERVHLSLRSPVVLGQVRRQRRTFWVLGGLLVLLGAFTTVLVPLSPEGEPMPREVPVVPIAVAVLGLVVLAYGVFLPQYYRFATTALERKGWAYLGDAGAWVELSPAGLALDAAARSVRIGWAYYDDVTVLETGLELRRLGGPVGFYPVGAFGTEAAMWQAADDVRRWITTAQR